MTTIDWLTNYPFARQAFVAAVAIGLVCSLLSVVVVLKRMAFIGQGISHAGFGGLGLAAFLGLTPGLAQDAVVLGFCLAAAMVIGLLSRRKRVEADTAIGVLLVAAMALGVLLNSLRALPWYVRWMGPQQPMAFEMLLFGSIVNVGREGMWLAIVVAAAVLAVGAAVFKELLFFSFDEAVCRVYGVREAAIYYLLLTMLTVTIVVSMKLAGVVLVTALLVIPAATALQLSLRLGWVLAGSALVGLSCTLGGLIISFELGEVPSGPCIVGLLCLAFAGAFGIRAVRRK